MAWAKVMNSAPMMADPARYRTIMYELFFEGKQPELTVAEKKRVDTRSDGKAHNVSKHEADALAALNAKAAQLRAEASK